jgi:hypothetical protein
MADLRHQLPDATGHNPRRHFGRRSVALIVAVKVAVVIAVLALPSWFAISLGAAHGVALAVVVMAAAVLLVVGAIRRRSGKTVLAAETRIETTNASRYLVQLCQHATKMGEHLRHGHVPGGHARPEVLGAESTDTHGTVDLSWGRCVLDADADSLVVRIEADTEEHLRAIQDIVAADLERFGHRDNVTVTWQPAVQANDAH